MVKLLLSAWQPPAPPGGPTSTVWHHKGHGWASHSYRHSCSNQKQELSFSDLHWSASLLSTIPDIFIYNFSHCILFSWFYLQIMFLLEPSASTIPTQHHASRKEKMGEQVRSNTRLLAFCRLSTTPTKSACANRAHFAPADSTEPPTCRATTFHFTAEQSLETNKLHSASTHPMDEQQGDPVHCTKNSCSGGKAKMRTFQERLHTSPCRRSDNLSHIASNALSCCLV